LRNTKYFTQVHRHHPFQGCQSFKMDLLVKNAYIYAEVREEFKSIAKISIDGQILRREGDRRREQSKIRCGRRVSIARGSLSLPSGRSTSRC
jgi:hypothetical protein